LTYPDAASFPPARGFVAASWRSPSRWWTALAGPAPTSDPVILDPDHDPALIATRVRTAILQALAERCPIGWRALLLSPPPHPRRMTWHVHLGGAVALDLIDGRTVPTAPPAASHEWTLPSGRRAAVAVGDPRPSPGPETRAIRVGGAYLSVTYTAGAAGSSRWLVSLGIGARRQGELRAPVRDAAAFDTLLREAVTRSIGQRLGRDGSAMGYTPTSWADHEVTWLEIGEGA